MKGRSRQACVRRNNESNVGGQYVLRDGNNKYHILSSGKGYTRKPLDTIHTGWKVRRAT